MPLTRRFTLRPEQKAAIEEMRKNVQTMADAPAEEVPTPEEPTASSQPEPVAEMKEAETTAPVQEETDTATSTPEETAAEEVPEKIVAEETAAEEVSGPKEEETKAQPEETEEEKKPKKRRASKKTEAPPSEVTVVSVSNAFKKKQELRAAMSEVLPEYIDTEFEQFKNNMEEDLLLTSFDETANSGTIRVILSHLGRCYDNVTQEYARLSTNLEHLTNKNYGLITRQIIMNAAGANDAERKMNGVHAPEVYKTANGKTVNLYALQAALDQEAIYLQMVMKKLEYKRNLLISYLTSQKIEAGILGD